MKSTTVAVALALLAVTALPMLHLTTAVGPSYCPNTLAPPPATTTIGTMPDPSSGAPGTGVRVLGHGAIVAQCHPYADMLACAAVSICTRAEKDFISTMSFVYDASAPVHVFEANPAVVGPGAAYRLLTEEQVLLEFNTKGVDYKDLHPEHGG